MDDCSVKYALKLLSGKWKLKILWYLAIDAPIRFNELQRKIDGISALMLSQTLKELEDDHLILRKQYEQRPPKVEYSLSELGRMLTPALESLGEWGHQVYLKNMPVPPE